MPPTSETPKAPRKYPLLNDRNWLFERYITQHQSLPTIAEAAGCKNHNSVRQALTRFQIKIRGLSEGVRGTPTEILCLDLETITGCLLGDASLYKHNKASQESQPRFAKKNKHLEHLEWVTTQLLGPKSLPKITPGQSTLRDKTNHYFQLKSLVHPELQSLYNDWYPSWNNYKKVVPRNITITPKVLLHWFLDDGTHRDKLKGTKRERGIMLCTECFIKADQEFLKQEMEKLGVSTQVTPYDKGTGWRIRIQNTSIPKFFEVIGPPPVQALAYKWNILSEEVLERNRIRQLENRTKNRKARFEKIQNRHRLAWLEILATRSSEGRNRLAKTKEFHWLYKWDRTWLKENLPPSLPYLGRKNSIKDKTTGRIIG
jgi:hypothetical protein